MNAQANAVSAWRRLLDRAIEAHSERPEARFAQLATFGSDGRPTCRTLVFRTFLDTAQLVFTTDLRSQKVAQLSINAYAEACWYFVLTREQFRLSGMIRASDGTADDQNRSLRLKLWQDLSKSARQAFTWPSPGEPREEAWAFESEPADDLSPHFGLLVLDPDRVDYLDLKPMPHQRRIFSRNQGRWSSQEVNP